MRISVFGLGYVGTVCAACLADRHSVIGVDVNPQKVDALNAGQSLLVEPGIEDLVRDAQARGDLRGSLDATEAVHQSDLSLVCVGTPSEANGSLDLDHVRKVCREIGEAIRTKSGPHQVVIRSTVLPGTTEEVVIPILVEASGRPIGQGLDVCFNPEFLREGSSVADFHQPPKIVIGESEPSAGDAVLAMYEGISAPVIRTTLRTAEMVKYTDNAFHALKVTFANEVGNLSKAMGIDGHEVMSIFCQDTKLNLSDAYLKPGFAFGGSCLPKDLRALTYRAKHLDLETPLLNAISESNQEQIRWLVRRIQSLRPARVGFLGMSFKAGTDDLRESPLVEAIETLLGKGFAVTIHDPDVSMSRLIGANRRYIEERVPHLSSLLIADLEPFLQEAELLVLGHRSTAVAAAIRSLRPDQFVIDLVGVEGRLDTPAGYEGICW